MGVGEGCLTPRLDRASVPPCAGLHVCCVEQSMCEALAHGISLSFLIPEHAK